MILTHLLLFDFFPGCVSVESPTETNQGGGGRKRKIKSWDQRQREREEEIRKYRPRPPEIPKVRTMAPNPYKRLSPETVKAYQAARIRDDEEAFSLIAGLL
jgi:hypothetical protein